MTARRRDGIESPFSSWVRGETRLDSIKERLSVIDCDYWVHQYRSHKDKIGDRPIDSIMLVELKTFSADLPFSQRDTLKLLNEGLRQAFSTKDGKVLTRRMRFGSEPIRLVRFYGAFLLQLSSDRPDRSKSICWHGRRIDLDTLVDILRFDLDPRNPLKKRSDRRHHAPSIKQAHPQLALVQR